MSSAVSPIVPPSYSGRGNVLEVIKSGVEIPTGRSKLRRIRLTHTIHRGLMSRVFTPRKVAALETTHPGVLRPSFLDPLVGVERFDVITEFAAEMPMQVIGMLLGIPEADQRAIRDKNNATLRTEGRQRP